MTSAPNEYCLCPSTNPFSVSASNTKQQTDFLCVVICNPWNVLQSIPINSHFGLNQIFTEFLQGRWWRKVMNAILLIWEHARVFMTTLYNIGKDTESAWIYKSMFFYKLEWSQFECLISSRVNIVNSNSRQKSNPCMAHLHSVCGWAGPFPSWMRIHPGLQTKKKKICIWNSSEVSL